MKRKGIKQKPRTKYSYQNAFSRYLRKIMLTVIEQGAYQTFLSLTFEYLCVGVGWGGVLVCTTVWYSDQKECWTSSSSLSTYSFEAASLPRPGTPVFLATLETSTFQRASCLCPPQNWGYTLFPDDCLVISTEIQIPVFMIMQQVLLTTLSHLSSSLKPFQVSKQKKTQVVSELLGVTLFFQIVKLKLWNQLL